MQKQTIQVFGVLALLVIGTNVAIFWAFSQRDKQDDEQSQTTTPPPPSDSSFSLGVSDQSNETSALAGNSGTPTPQPQIVGQTPSVNTPAPQELPGPDQFTAYEEYADATNTLFIDIVEGSGAIAEAGNTVHVAYSGWLTSGELFDQTTVGDDGRVQAFAFQLGGGQVIRGWDEGVAGMREGGKRRLVIPAALAYGEQGIEGRIPPNSMLIFDVELALVEGL